MIPKPYIAKWKDHAPWNSFEQIEQDLVISRALVDIFSDDFLSENLAFRGGTALHKCIFKSRTSLFGGHRLGTNKARSNKTYNGTIKRGNYLF
jgi:hypothetical protein